MAILPAAYAPGLGVSGAAVTLAVLVALLSMGTAQAESGTLVRTLPVGRECVPISLTGQFASKSAAESLSRVPDHLVGFRREAMNTIAAQKRPRAGRVSEIAVNAVADSSLTVPAALIRNMLLGLGADEEAVARLPERDYTASYLDPGVYLFETSVDGPSEFRLLTAQPYLAFVLPDQPLGVRLDVMVYAIEAKQFQGTGQVIYPHPVCLTAEIATGGLTVDLGELGKLKNGGIVVTTDAIRLLPGTDYTPSVPPVTSAVDAATPELAAVAEEDDAATLAQIALSTKSTKVILAVIEKVDDQEALKRLAVELQWPRGREYATLKVTDQSFLAAAARGNDMPMVRRAAVWKLEDQKTLLDIALFDGDYAIRRDAAGKIDDPTLLKVLVDTSAYQWVTDIANKSMGREEGTLNQNGRLIKAAAGGNIEHVSRLLDDGATVDSVDRELNTALIKAALAGNAQIASLLLASGADVNGKNNRRVSALASASAHGRDSVVAILLRNGATVDSTASDMSTPLMLAAFNGHATTVAALIEARASVDHQSKDGRTALMLAARQGHADIVAMLMQARADATLKDANGKTAAQVAKSTTISEMITPTGGDQQAASAYEARARITDGSYKWDNGKLQTETSFDGETIVLDVKNGGVAKLESGMTKEQVIEALAAGNVQYEMITTDEWKAGDMTLIFFSGRLTRLRNH